MLTDSTAAVRLGAGRAAWRLTVRRGGNQGLRHRAEGRQQQAHNIGSHAEDVRLACSQWRVWLSGWRGEVSSSQASSCGEAGPYWLFQGCYAPTNGRH